MSSRSCRSGTVRRRAISSLSSASTGERMRFTGPAIIRSPASTTSISRHGSPIQSSSCASSERSRSSRVPKTARMMISSVSACIRGRVAIG